MRIRRKIKNHLKLWERVIYFDLSFVRLIGQYNIHERFNKGWLLIRDDVCNQICDEIRK